MAERTIASYFDRRPAVPNNVAPGHNTPVSRFAPKGGAPRVASETPELDAICERLARAMRLSPKVRRCAVEILIVRVDGTLSLLVEVVPDLVQ
jgi:hypothetical protein